MLVAPSSSSVVPLDQVDPSTAAETGRVEVRPATLVRRRITRWQGNAAEIVQTPPHQRVELRFHGTRHLLVVCAEGIRCAGETFVEGLPRSTLRDVARRLTFVPAGRIYREWHEPRLAMRMVYFYFDGTRLPVPARAGVAAAPLTPRLLFEDATLSTMAGRLEQLIETNGASGQPYLEALGTILAYELIGRIAGTLPSQPPAKGGLAPWQLREVTTYIEEHLTEPIALATLARLARLSRYHFCRAFRQSLGLPPHRYHSRRRMEYAKRLLARPAASVTEVGMTLGYSETSSFTAAFHKAIGLTPTAYRQTHACEGVTP